MGLAYCVSTLKSSTKLLNQMDLKLAKLEKTNREAFKAQVKKRMPESVINDQRVHINQHLADMALVTTQVQKYCVILKGIPIKGALDQYTADSTRDRHHDSDSDSAIRTFMAKTAWRTGLIPLMQATCRNEPVTDAEIFATYCAMGCVSFTAFELAVHRAVDGVADRIWRMAVEMKIVNQAGRRIGKNRKVRRSKYVGVGVSMGKSRDGKKIKSKKSSTQEDSKGDSNQSDPEWEGN